MAGWSGGMSARLVLDANILIRAVLGSRVRELLSEYEDAAEFFAPELCFDEAARWLLTICSERNLDQNVMLEGLEDLRHVVRSVSSEFYEEFRDRAMKRIGARDEADWPVVATALLLNCPVWTEDRDFFGSGVATWTTATVEFYLGEG